MFNKSQKIKADNKQIQFPCDNCGALQRYIPGTDHLHCDYCNHESLIATSYEAIREYPFREALRQLQEPQPKPERLTTQCDNCAAEFNFEQNIHSGSCPFCGTPIVSKTESIRFLKPKSLIPFKITEQQAKARYSQWLKGLWFAPSKLKQFARTQSGLTGVYVPYWTYDSNTKTSYSGERGDSYQVPQQVVMHHKGRRSVQTRMVTKVRWRRVSGNVSRFFDDVLVGASKSLPRSITDRLKPWDLTQLIPFDEAWLSGFYSEVYQVRLDEGFNQALQIMDGIIRNDVARDIGGDFQRIHHVDTVHNQITYKHLLLPIWWATFNFRNRTFRFVVNGQTGKVRGERPYSWLKIAAAIIGGTLMTGVILWAINEAGMLEQI